MLQYKTQERDDIEIAFYNKKNKKNKKNYRKRKTVNTVNFTQLNGNEGGWQQKPKIIPQLDCVNEKRTKHTKKKKKVFLEF